MLKGRGAILIVVSLFFLGMMAINVYAKTPFDEKSIVRQKCSVCHKIDDKGRVEVIEETRKSPEEWRAIITRMIRINGAPVSEDEQVLVVKDLSRYLGLTPSEMAKVAQYNSGENSHYMEGPAELQKYMKTYDEKLATQILTTCKRCHTFSKIASHKKTLEQWAETRAMHIGYVPTVIFQMREMDWPKAFKDLLPTLHELFPAESSEWDAWMKSYKDPDISGAWKIAGYQQGVGYYQGQYTIQANSAKGKDEYLVSKSVRYDSGLSVMTSGEGTLYSGYHLRYWLAPTAMMGRMEGVFDLDQETMGFTGKWWTVVQDTNAFGNEMFYKSDAPARIFAIYPQALKAGESQTVTMVGVGLPSDLAGAITFPDSKVKVSDVKVADGVVTCTAEAESGAPVGMSKVAVSGAACDQMVKVYQKMDAIKVSPAMGMARVSCGAAYPPIGMQFVARGVSYGADGKPDTADDLVLEPVNATWSLEEQPRGADGAKKYAADDFKWLSNTPFVNGLYTPTTTYGPIMERMGHKEGVGLIAVAASYEGMTGKAQLTVADTDFVTHIY